VEARGNKPTAGRPLDDAAIAIFEPTSTSPLAEAISLSCQCVAGRSCNGAEGIGQMLRVRSLLRAAPAQIGRRLAQLVAIAAASLPEVGA
jgi:hypothetical protein